MKEIRSLFLWFFFLIYAFFFLIFIIICTYLFKIETYEPWLKFLLRLFLTLAGVRVQVEGLENFSKDGVYIFMANHVSLFDVAVLGGYIPNIFRGIEADRQFKWPLYGFTVKRIGNIPINRKNPVAAMKSIEQAVKKIKNGLSIAVLPEGHRTLTGNMKPFKQLPFLLAKRAGKALIPIGLSGLFSLKKKGSWIIKPGRVKVKFGNPIKPEEIDKMSVNELRDFVKAKIEDLIEYQ